MTSSNANEEPARMTVAQRIAALQKKDDDNKSPAPKPKPNKINIASDINISALQKTVEPAFVSSQEKYASAMANESASKAEAPTTNTDADDVEGGKVGKLKKLPPGAVPVMMPFGAGLPPSLMKKRMEREKQNEKLREESHKQQAVCDGDDSGVDDVTKQDGDEDALLSRPTIQGGKRRPKT